MKQKTMRYLNISLIVVSLFCVAIFAIQAVCINIMGKNTVRKLGVFYMSGISEQVTSHFSSVIELRLSQVESLVNAVPPGRNTSETSKRISLTYNARMSGFEYLAFYTDDGEFHMLYGSQITADVPEDLHRLVQGGKNNVCAGKDAAGIPVVLLGVPALYPMGDGTSSVALVAGLPTSHLRDTLENNIQDQKMEYFITRDDGSYVLLINDTIEETNYFERIANNYETCNGKSPDQYARELHAALDADIDYTCEAVISGEHWNIYCAKLPNSEWHLLLKVPHSTLDEAINTLQRQWRFISVVGGALIIGALLLVFVGYYRLTKTHLRELDAARLSAERSNRAKNEFLSNMSHDIRTPMNGIMGMTSVAIGSLDNPSRVRSCLKKIHVSSRHLLGLINDMLDMSKIESGRLSLNIEPISLREIMQNVETVIRPQIQEKNQHFYIYIHDICHENLCSDRIRLSQILLNILGNAVKFTPEGGTIVTDLYEEPSPKGDGFVRSHLHVTDNGIGMSEEFKSCIFDAFAREDNARVEKAAGAGMGMTITKYIVDAMDGTITVDSEQGKGTHFQVTLDMEKATQQEKGMCLPPRDVLVVMEDETAAALALSALESIGLRARYTTGLDEAVRLVEEGSCSILLLDQEVQGRDGIVAAKELAGRFGPGLRILLLASGEWDEREAEAEEAGIVGFIPKPLFRSGLYYGLRPFVEANAPAQEEAGMGAGLAGKRLLIAEDNELNWEIASEMLAEYGLETEWAENGRICVEKFRQSEPGWFYAILMDLRMPVMTGFEAAEAIRALPRDDAKTVPIIAVSADAFAEDIQKCLAYGMNTHSAKPLNPENVIKQLSEYL